MILCLSLFVACIQPWDQAALALAFFLRQVHLCTQFSSTEWNQEMIKTSWTWAVPSSDQLKLATCSCYLAYAQANYNTPLCLLGHLKLLFLQWLCGLLDQLRIMQTKPRFAGVWVELGNKSISCHSRTADGWPDVGRPDGWKDKKWGWILPCKVELGIKLKI